MDTDLAGYGRYTSVIENQLLLDTKDMTFKSDPTYCEILEHTHPNLGKQYLDLIIKKWGKIFIQNMSLFQDMIKKNDSIGKPQTIKYSQYIDCSPSNLRYIFYSFLILNDIKSKNMSEVNIIEIGGGYGGLCFYIQQMSHLYDITVRKYALFDLEHPMKLQDRFLREVGISNHITCTMNDLSQLEENSYLISCYSFSEIAEKYQLEYTNNVLNSFVKNGFMAWNAIDVYDFMDNVKMEVSPEEPSSGPFSKNKFVMFSKE
jgi:hypothetical protein